MAVIDFRPNWREPSAKMQRRRAKAWAKVQAPSTVDEMNRIGSASRKLAHLAIWAGVIALSLGFMLTGELILSTLFN